MTTKTLTDLVIHKLTREQYDRELKAGRIDEDAIYITPDADLSIYATIEQLTNQSNNICQMIGEKVYASDDEPEDAPEGSLWVDLDAISSGGHTGGSSSGVSLDSTLTKYGYAADARAVGKALENKQDKGNYATENFVLAKIAAAQLSGGEADLSGYVTGDDLSAALDSVMDQAKSPFIFPLILVSGSGWFVSDAKWGIDIPYSDIVQAYNDGRSVYALIEGTSAYIFSMYKIDGFHAVFSNTDGNNCCEMEIRSNGDVFHGFIDFVTYEALDEAINTALEEAKENGNFNGDDGKSAFEYARDGGFVGTEEEFAVKMAKNFATEQFVEDKFDASKPLIVTEENVSFQEIINAVNEGRFVQAVNSNGIICNLSLAEESIGAVFVTTDGNAVFGIIVMPDNQWQEIENTLPNVDDYYVKADIDSNYYTKTDIDSNYYTKTDVDKLNKQCEEMDDDTLSAAREYTNTTVEELALGFEDVIYQMYGDDLTDDGAPTIRQIANDEANTALVSAKTYMDKTVPAWAKQSTKPTYTANEVGAVSANTTITLFGIDTNGITHTYTIYGKEDENAPQ